MDDLIDLPDEKPEEIPPEELPPKAMLAVIRFIDHWIGEWSGKIFAWFIIPLVGGLVYEVFARYLFNAPTIWAIESTYQFYAAHFMLGATYTLYMGKHIRTDLIYDRYPVKWQGRVDAVLYLFFFFPGMILFLMAGWDEAMHSWAIREVSEQTPWRPPLYPFKTVIPVAGVLLLIQGVSELLKSIHASIRGRWI